MFLLSLMTGVVLLFLVTALIFRHPEWLDFRRRRFELAKRRFHAQRERLEAKFVQLAAARSGGRTQQWADCTFADEVAYVRNRSTGELAAFVAVTISSDELEHSAGCSSDAVGNLQAGTAIFRFDHDHWETDGRAILNLSPEEAVAYYRHDLEIVAEESGKNYRYPDNNLR